MLSRSLLNCVLDNEALTRNLGDVEARALIEWMVDRAEHLGAGLPLAEADGAVRGLVRRGRAISRFVRLWCIEEDHAGAIQFAASERLDGPLPDGPIEAWELMQTLLRWEDRPRQAA